MKTYSTCMTGMIGTAAILTCILFPVSGFAVESSVNEQLVQAVKNGDLDKVKTLSAQGADVNAEVDGRAVLMWAVDPRNRMRAWPMLKESVQKACSRSVNRDLVKFLVDQGADVNAKDSGGYTAPMCAAQMADLAIVKYLVDKGADVNTRWEGRYDYAAASGQNMWGPCWALQEPALALAAESESVEIMEFLIDKGADMNVKDECGCTALLRAVQWGRPHVAKFLIKKGADLNVRDKKGETALTAAHERGHLEIVKHLIGKGADTNMKGDYGITALMKAAGSGNLELVKLLIEKGADVNARNNDGKTALSLASALNRTAIVQYLKAHGAK
jgi:ankyrin repeat protein